MAALTVFLSAAPADAAFAERLRQAIIANKGNVVSTPPATSPAAPAPDTSVADTSAADISATSGASQFDVKALQGARAYVAVVSQAALASPQLQAEAQQYVATASGQSKPKIVPVQLEPMASNATLPALQRFAPVTGPYGTPQLQDALIAETLRRLGLPPQSLLALPVLLIASLLALLLLACIGTQVIAPGGGLHFILGGVGGGQPRGSTAATATPTSAATPTPSGTGLLGQYYRSRPYGCCIHVPDDLFGQLLYTETDPQVNIRVVDNQYPDPRLQGGAYAIRWTGQVRARYSETYTFITHSDDAVRVWVNGQLLIDDWSTHAEQVDQNTIALTAGQLYAIKVEYYENGEGHGGIITLQWQSATQQLEIIPASQLYPAQP
jgi:hypothetical protein